MPTGPLQVLVVNFDEANFSGEIEAELKRLEEAGTLRVLNVLVVAKDDAGEIEVVRSMHEIAEVILGDEPVDERELTGDEWAIADSIEPGGAAAIAILEHTWAIPLARAIEGAGGRNVTAEWASAEDLESMGVPVSA